MKKPTVTTWSEAFHLYIMGRWPLHQQRSAATALKVSPSAVLYWCRGSRPRDKTRARIERWSGGAVAATLPSAAAA